MLNAGDRKGAETWAVKAVSVTPSLVYNVIHAVLRKRGIKYMVAQGEADGQLAYLQLSGEVDAVASLDGDGSAWCHRILHQSKLPHGRCVSVQVELLGEADSAWRAAISSHIVIGSPTN